MKQEIIITKVGKAKSQGIVLYLNEAARLKTGTGAFTEHWVSWDKIGKLLFDNYTERVEVSDLNELRNVYNKKTEKEIIETMQGMCEESLSPDVFEKWEDVRKMLENNRKAFINIRQSLSQTED